MAFQTSLSGLNGAQSNLSVTGNNIANASTTGFKKSRAEFVDIYASAFSGVAGNAIGAGVRLADVSQQFTQGNIEFTEKNLDLAINGNGFFQLRTPSGTVYSRNGSFHTDSNGFVVNAQGQILQAYQADAAGNITGAIGDMQISTADLAPQATSSIVSGVNLNAQAAMPNGAGASSTATVVGTLETGAPPAVSPVSTAAFTLVGNDGLAVNTAQLQFTTTGVADQWTVTLAGVPGTVTSSVITAGTTTSTTLTWDPDGAAGYQSPITLTVDTSGLTGGAATAFTSASADGVQLPAFDPNDPTTYNNSTSLTVYDSLGGSHLATMYFVKVPEGNAWEAYTYVDGVDVSAGTLGRTPSYLMEFSTTGALASIDGVPAPPTTLLTTTFTPVTSGGASTPAPMQLTMDFGSSSQYGSPFAVNALSQDGYATGRLSTIDIDSDGIVFARYSNGRALAQGQLVLAAFANPNGLSPLGDSTWGETADSGVALTGAANTSSLGAIQSGALEASNVDLSRELVNMILAQRDFQANAKMISTEDAVTQTIINIR